MRGKSFAIFITCLLVGLLPSTSQSELNFEILTVDNGLSSSVINSILQDDEGYIWIATRDGLNRYDGVNIEVIRFSKKNNIVSSIVAADDGGLWVGVVGLGLVYYDPETEETKIYSESNENKLRDNDITFIHEDTAGNIWLGTKLQGLEKLDVASGTSTSFLATEGDPNITYFHEDRKGRIWVGTDAGILYQFNEIGQDFEVILIDEESQGTITCIIDSDENGLLIGTDFGVFFLDTSTNQFEFLSIAGRSEVQAIWIDNKGLTWAALGNELINFSLEENSVLSTVSLVDHRVVPKYMDRNSWNYNDSKIYLTTQNELPVIVDQENNFWLITNKGLDMYNPARKVLKRIRVEDSFTNFNRAQITCSFMDRAGSLWFGTVGGGINKYNGSKFQLFQYKRDVPSSLANHGVLSFHESESGPIWIGNNGGSFSLFDPKKENFKRFKVPASNSVIFDIEKTSEKDLWLASAGKGLVHYKVDIDKFSFYQHDPNMPGTISSNQVQAIFRGSDKYLWIGTDKGLSVFDTEKKEFKNVPLATENEQEPNIFNFTYADGTLWAATLGQGIVGVDLKDTLVTSRYNSTILLDQGLNDYITSIHVDNSEVLWAGTYGGGLIRIDVKNGDYQVINEESGLLNNVIYYVTEDSSNYLWFTSNAGLAKYDKSSGEVVLNFDKTDGLQSNEFNRGSGLQLRSGEILVGGINGFNCFNPKAIKRKTFLSNTVITDFEIFDKPAYDKLANAQISKQPIILEHTENFLTVGFVTLDFRNPTKNRYRYRMQGLSNQWTYIANQEPRAVFTSLDPGSYVFELLSANSDGVWMDQAKRLEIVVLPPYWQTIWFRVLVIFLIVALAVIIPYGRIQRLRKRSLLLNQLVEDRTYELQEKNIKLKETLNSLKETQSQLIESEKMASLGVLSAGVGHEINNPLNFIQGGAYALSQQLEKDKVPSKDKYKEILDVINEGVNRASNIVKSLGHFSRQREESDESCDVESIIDNCLTLLSTASKDKVQISKDYGANGFTFLGNEGRLHQAFLNILSNAIQAIPERGKIEIITEKTDHDLVVWIKDDGIGMSEEVRKQVLDPFFSTKPPGEGTGLGLSITYTILKDHNASLNITSRESVGTTVEIKFRT